MTTYKYLAETADRRTAQYKKVQNDLDELIQKYGYNSKQVNKYFNKEIL
jgi:hypothetical protein